MTEYDLLEEIKHFKSRWIIWTGEEPTLQLTEDIVNFFSEFGYNQAIETKFVFNKHDAKRLSNLIPMDETDILRFKDIATYDWKKHIDDVGVAVQTSLFDTLNDRS
jgi:organic radical activating enzyme